MKVINLIFAGAVLVSLASPTLAITGTPAATTDAAVLFGGDGPWTLGWSFTVNSSITVVGLGAWDRDGNGFTDSHTVGLWENGGALLASTGVGSGDTLIAGFRYAGIGPVTLTPGMSYVVGASDLGVNDDYVLDSNGSVISQITYGQVRYFSGSGLTRPDFSDPTRSFAYFGANFLTAPVPEPSSWAMMIAGFGLVGAAARRRRTAISA